MDQNQPSLQYRRVSRVRASGEYFTPWYVIAGALGVVIGLWRLCANAFTLLMVPFHGATTIGVAGVVYFSIGLVLSVALVSGSIASFWRQPWSRRVLLMGATADLILQFTMLALVLGGAIARVVRLDVISIVVFFGLLVQGALWRFIYTNIRADFYFISSTAATDGPTMGEPHEIVPLTAKQGGVAAGSFMVHGVEAATGKEVEFLSKARTEELARKSAAMLGLEPTSIVITPVSETPENPH
jgi:hypothetical protein